MNEKFSLTPLDNSFIYKQQCNVLQYSHFDKFFENTKKMTIYTSHKSIM